jgi:thiamine biosynthesis lipoprotein
MKETRIMMGMTVTVEIADHAADPGALAKAFSYFDYIDRTFSTYKEDSEISKINRGLLAEGAYSDDMRTVLRLAEMTKLETDGYFDIRNLEGRLDPSGIVKGWAIWNAAKLLEGEGLRNFYIDAGGDVQANGKNTAGEPWRVGIRNPFKPEAEVIKILSLEGKGIATSGTYARGSHIYDPIAHAAASNEIVSLTVIGPNVYEADRFATAAFAMGRAGITFIEERPELEGYMVDKAGVATMTSGFDNYVIRYA